MPRHVVYFFVLLLALLLGCRSSASRALSGTAPSHDRNWQTPLAVLPRAKIAGDQVKVYNVRDFRYAAPDVYIANYDDRIYDLRELKAVDFVVVPFRSMPSLAHTMISFGFEGDEHLAVSVEARLEEGEQYDPLKGALGQYELMYVVADERDVIPLRTEHRDVDVHVYKTRATPEQAQLLFADVVHRVNELARQPEFYHTLTNNCTTNIRDHVNRVFPNRVPWDFDVLLNGRSARLAYHLRLLETDQPFEEARRQALVNPRVPDAVRMSNFSAAIRRF